MPPAIHVLGRARNAESLRNFAGGVSGTIRGVLGRFREWDCLPSRALESARNHRPDFAHLASTSVGVLSHAVGALSQSGVNVSRSSLESERSLESELTRVGALSDLSCSTPAPSVV
jgi:hypothetical protein